MLAPSRWGAKHRPTGDPGASGKPPISTRVLSASPVRGEGVASAPWAPCEEAEVRAVTAHGEQRGTAPGERLDRDEAPAVGGEIRLVEGLAPLNGCIERMLSLAAPSHQPDCAHDAAAARPGEAAEGDELAVVGERGVVGERLLLRERARPKDPERAAGPVGDADPVLVAEALEVEDDRPVPRGVLGVEVPVVRSLHRPAVAVHGDHDPAPRDEDLAPVGG